MDATHTDTSDRVEAELLGICIRHPAVIDEVACILAREDYRRDAHQKLWRTLLDMQGGDTLISLVTVADHLHRAGFLEDVGGYPALGKMAGMGPLPQPALPLARRVRDYSILRQLHLAGDQILAMANSPYGSAEEMLGEAEKHILAIAQTGLTGQATSLDEILSLTADRLDARLENRAPVGIPTGLTHVDNITGGLQNGELLVIGARPGAGKTSLGLALAREAALRSKVTTLFVSLEQSAGELSERLLSSLSGVDGNRIRRGQFRDQIQDVIDANAALQGVPLWIDDAPAQSMTRIAATARRLRRQHNLGLVVVDYLQLVEPDNRKEPRQEQVARISRRCKHLARDLSIPVVALAQLNRGLDGRVSRKPRLSDLRESGQLEQDADTVFLIHRAEEEEKGTRIELIIAKHRNGPTGEVELEYHRHLYRFEDAVQQPSF